MRLNNKKILVTGGGGFIGSHLCKRLVESGAQVRITDTFSSGRLTNLISIEDKLEIIKGDILNKDIIKKSCLDASIIIHTAFPMELRKQIINSEHIAGFFSSLFNLINESVQNKSLFVYISSIAVYGEPVYIPVDENHPLDPVMVHGALKLAGEHMCRAFSHSHGLRYIILRPADIYGPRNSRINLPAMYLLNALRGEPLKVYGFGEQKRTFTYIDDFVDAVLKALVTPDARGKILNISGSGSTSVLELACKVKNITGCISQVIKDNSVTSDNRQLVIDSKFAGKLLNLKTPVPLDTGIKKTWDWLQKNPGFYN